MVLFMQVFNQSNQISTSLFEIEEYLSEVASDCVCNFKNKLIGAIFYGKCQNIKDNSINDLQQYLLDCKVTKENSEKINAAINRIRGCIYKIPLQQSSLHGSFLPVRLKGQEKLHFYGTKCTSNGYTGDDGYPFCILERDSRNSETYSLPFRATSQQFGYQEISLGLVEPQAIYTLMLGPCIAILMIGIRRDGILKACLMHEDYSEPEGSVTSMFEHSFQSDLKEFNELRIFLIGGNGGEKYTKNRFNIHRSEISNLQDKYRDLINFSLSTDKLNSINVQFEWDCTNVFFTSVESSTYLWILQSSPSGCCVEKICVSGAELSLEKLALYYQEKILPLLQPSQKEFHSFI